MNGAAPHIRRATLDDVQALVAIWQSMTFPADELAKRVTEFQVAESAEGQVLGAIGLQIAERQGLIHSEGFDDFSVAERVRPLLWDRLRALANNHGLLRVWTQEQAPFWRQCGLTPPDDGDLERLPAIWRGAARGWLTLKLREDIEDLASADQQFALFMAAEKQRTQRTMQQGKALKLIATLIAFGLLGLVIAGAVYLVRQNPGLIPR